MLHRLMEQLKNNKKSVFNHAAQIIILLVVIKYFYDMINPIIKVAQYSHPTMDDYWMTTYVHEQWLENHSVLGFIAAAFRYAIGIYKTWDGNFLSMFITSMSPAVFGDYAYSFTFYFMFVTFCIGSLAGEYPKVCVNLQTDVRYNYSVWRLFLWQEKKTAHKKQQ